MFSFEDSEINKLIFALCVIFSILTSIIISNKWHEASSFFERVVGVIFCSIGFFWTYVITIYLVFYITGI